MLLLADEHPASRKSWAMLSCGVLGALLGGIAGYFLGVYYLNPIFPSQETLVVVSDSFQKKMAHDPFGGVPGFVQGNKGLWCFFPKAHNIVYIYIYIERETLFRHCYT